MTVACALHIAPGLVTGARGRAGRILRGAIFYFATTIASEKSFYKTFLQISDSRAFLNLFSAPLRFRSRGQARGPGRTLGALVFSPWDRGPVLSDSTRFVCLCGTASMATLRDDALLAALLGPPAQTGRKLHPQTLLGRDGPTP